MTMKRRYRGSVYHINIKDPRGAQQGVVRIIADGKEIEGTLVPPLPKKKERKIEVILG
jgi:cellobiose phosphorylase